MSSLCIHNITVYTIHINNMFIYCSNVIQKDFYKFASHLSYKPVPISISAIPNLTTSLLNHTMLIILSQITSSLSLDELQFSNLSYNNTWSAMTSI